MSKKPNPIHAKLFSGVFIFMLVLVGATAGMSLVVKNQDIRQQAYKGDVKDLIQSCKLTTEGSGWQTFIGCDDSCALPINCEDLPEHQSCDCGENKCWNGTECVDDFDDGIVISREEFLCKNTEGASWESFADGCFDYCDVPKGCSEMNGGMGCNCGEGRCWNGRSCEEITDCNLIGDFNEDGRVDKKDQELFISYVTYYFQYDIASKTGDISGENGTPDGRVDIWDYSEFAKHYGETCPGVPTHTPLPPP